MLRNLSAKFIRRTAPADNTRTKIPPGGGGDFPQRSFAFVGVTESRQDGRRCTERHKRMLVQNGANI